MPRRYSKDEQYNSELERTIENNEYVQEILGKYREYEDKYIKPAVENLESLKECYVPQEPYEGKADEMVCAPEPSTRYENDGTLEKEVAEMLKEDEKTANEMIDCVSGDGPESLKSITEEIKKKADEMSELKQIKDKFDEFYYNARFYEYYLEIKNSKKRKASKLDQNVIYLELVAQIAIYSTNVAFTYNPLTQRILNYTVHMNDYRELKSYTRLNTNDGLDIFRSKDKFKIKGTNKANNHGVLYGKYYDELSDPIENLFTMSERGMTKRNNKAGSLQTASMDDKGNPVSYISDVEKYKNFYNTLDKKLPAKKKALYNKYCLKQVEKIEAKIRKLVEAEGLFGINKDEKVELKKFREFHDEYRKIEKRIEQLEKELTPDAINAMLAKNPCFTPSDNETPPEVAEDLVGGFRKPGGRDQENPTMEQNCYWVKFCTLATMYGLLPFPEPVMKMRYWGIGLKMATPSGILNIPFPTIWLPVVTTTTKFGIFVVLIGQIGIIPHPFVLWINKEGIARFVITMYGVNLNGDVIGFDPNEDYKLLLDKAISIPRIGLNDLTEGVFNMETFLNVEKTDDFDDDLVDIGELNEISLQSTMQEINNLMYAVDDAKEKLKQSIPVFDVLSKISNDLNSAIDSIELPDDERIEKLYKYADKYAMTIEEYRDMAIEYLDMVKFPEIPMIDEVDLYKLLNIPSPSAKIDEMIKMLEQIPMPNVDLGDLKQVKTFILNRLMREISSGKIQEMIMKMPEELNLDLEDDFNKVRDFIAEMCEDIIASINPMIIHLPTYLNEYLDTALDASMNIGFDCGGKTVDLHLDVDPQTLAMLKLVESFITTPWRELTYEMVMQYIVNKVVKRSQLVDFAKYLIEELLPDYEFPFDLNVNPYEIMLKILKIMKLISDPKAAIEPFYKKLVQQVSLVSVNLEMFKSEIAKFIVYIAEMGLIPVAYMSVEDLKMYLHGIVNLVFNQQMPMFIQKYIGKAFGTVEGMENFIKKTINESMPKLFQTVDQIKEAITLVNKVARIIKIIKNSRISMNSLDNAFSPQAFLDNVEKTIKCAMGIGEDCVQRPSLCDIVLAEKAIELLEKANFFKYPVVAAACWTDRVGADIVIRNTHPCAYADDFPPYERLTLNNPLFCLFLDDFCHISKQYALFGEKYGIG